MKGKLGLLWLGCLLTALVGCAQIPLEAPAQPVSAQVKVVLPPVEELVFSPGEAVTVSGKTLTGLVWENVTYISLKELTDALGVTLDDVPLSPALRFPWRGQPVVVMPDSTNLGIGDREVPLSGKILFHEGKILVPARDMAGALTLGLYEDTENRHLYLTPEAGHRDIPTGYHVPTLMYHGVGDQTWGFEELFVRPADLEAQLQYIRDNGYTTIHFSDLAQVDTIQKPVLLTFDDGYVDNYTELYPLLQKYNAKATVFVVTGALGVNPNFMTWEQAKEMSDSGLVSIQSHTVTHRDLTSLTAEEQRRELAQAKLDIVRNIGREPYVLCYPTGFYNWDTLNAMEGLYAMGVKINGNAYYTDHSPLEINRWYVARYTSLYTFGDMLKNN